MKKLKALAIPILALAGCATQPFPGMDPTNTAKVRFNNLSNDKYNMRLTTQEPGTCKDKGYIAWITGGRDADAQRLGMLDSPPVREGVVERLVPAGEPLRLLAPSAAKVNAFATLTVLGLSRDYVASLIPGVCKVPEFVPERNQQYEVDFFPEPGKCTAVLKRLRQAENGAIIKEVMNKNSIDRLCQ